MNPFMYSQVVLFKFSTSLVGHIGTLVTGIRLFVGVAPFMLFQIHHFILRSEFFVTLVTGIGLFVGMAPFMFFQIHHYSKPSSAAGAGKWFFSCMVVLVLLQSDFRSEFLVTLVTGIRLFVGVAPFMLFQIHHYSKLSSAAGAGRFDLFLKWFVTMVAGKGLLPGVGPFMAFHIFIGRILWNFSRSLFMTLATSKKDMSSMSWLLLLS